MWHYNHISTNSNNFEMLFIGALFPPGTAVPNRILAYSFLIHDLFLQGKKYTVSKEGILPSSYSSLHFLETLIVAFMPPLLQCLPTPHRKKWTPVLEGAWGVRGEGENSCTDVQQGQLSSNLPCVWSCLALPPLGTEASAGGELLLAGHLHHVVEGPRPREGHQGA